MCCANVSDFAPVQITQKVYQATSIEPNATLSQHWPDAATILQKITYNENNDPIYLDGKNGDYAFEYGLNESRQAMHYGGNFDPALASQQAKFSKYYSEDWSYEVILDRTTGKEKHLMYIGGSPYESDIVLIKDFVNATAKYVFLHKDYLGTILAISSDTGAILEQRHFDAWGVFTHFSNIYGATTPPLGAGGLLIDRGYTSHEHLQDVGIIHMNGRLYDPLMRRFLNADENIQDPYNTQNYNKYGYVMNNPLLFNDPSGEIIFLGIAMALVVKAMIIGAAVGLASYTIGLALTGNLWRFSGGGALKAMFWGAVSGAVTFGVGELFTVAKTTAQTALGSAIGAKGSAAVIFTQASCHAVAQGALSMMQGGKFLSGATAGFLGHLGGAGWEKAFGNSDVGAIAFGAVSGGVGAEFTGGNFWQGAVTGGIVAGLNGVLHKSGGDPPSGKKAPTLDEANEFYRKNKNYNTIYEVDASSVDLNFVDTTDWKLESKHLVRTLLKSKHGKVFGTLEVIYKGNNQVQILDNRYDFNLEFSNPLKVSEFLSPRNFFTAIGDIYAGEGTSFMFRFKGLNTISNNANINVTTTYDRISRGRRE